MPLKRGVVYFRKFAAGRISASPFPLSRDDQLTPSEENDVDAISSWEQAAREAVDWLSPDQAIQVAQMAHEIIEELPNSRVLSLGQSPAWVVKAIEHEAKLRGLNYETGYIPFSGNFCRRLRTEGETHYYEIDANKLFAKDITRYHNRLIKLGMSPDNIIRRFENEGTTTTITDFLFTGKGTASFLYVLFDWARKDRKEGALRKALNVRLYDDAGAPPSFIKLEGFDPIPCNIHVMDSRLRDVFWNCEDRVRIVPSYPQIAWSRKPMPAEGEKAVVENTANVLRQAVVVNCLAPHLYGDWAQNGSCVLNRLLGRASGMITPVIPSLPQPQQWAVGVVAVAA